MKSVLVLWFGLVVVCVSNVSSEHLSEHDVVGVAVGNKTNELIKKALLGLGNLLRTGDDKLALPIMDPYKIEELFWHHEDEDSGTKLHLSCTGPAVLKGLSDFDVSSVQFDLKRLLVVFQIEFKLLKLEAPYKLEGVIGNVLPVYGENIAKITIKDAESTAIIFFSLEESRIAFDTVKAYSSFYNRNFDIPGLMDLPSEFSGRIIEDAVMPYISYDKVNKWTKKFVLDEMEKHFIGKTMNEATELLNYLAQKAN